MTRLSELPASKNYAFLLALQNQGFTPEQAEDVINDPSKAKLVVDALQPTPSVRSFNQFESLLYSLDEQKELLLRLNEQLPKEQRFPASWLTKLDTTSNHVQSVEDLEFFFVVFSTLEKTWDFNRKLIELTQPRTWDSGFGKDETQMRLDPNAVVYEPGIHRVRINLVDNWLPERGRSVDQVRFHASEGGKKLAGIEVIGAYGLQDPKLLRSQDGEALPYCDLAGLQQGVGFAQVPFFLWNRSYREAFFDSWRSDNVDANFAAPSLREY